MLIYISLPVWFNVAVRLVLITSERKVVAPRLCATSSKLLFPADLKFWLSASTLYRNPIRITNSWHVNAMFQDIGVAILMLYKHKNY